MKALSLLVIAVACLASSGAFAQRQNNPYGNPYGKPYGEPYGTVQGSGYVNSDSHTRSGYVRQNGTYVAPSYATNPNSTRTDNYTTKGNVNPYTGKAGTRR